MKKEAKVEFGITITKPWSKEMYAHNEMVAEAVRILVTQRWENALNAFEERYSDLCDAVIELDEVEFANASAELKKIQRAVTVYMFGRGYDVARVSDIVITDLEDAPYYRLKDIAEDLELDLKVGFVGF